MNKTHHDGTSWLEQIVDNIIATTWKSVQCHNIMSYVSYNVIIMTEIGNSKFIDYSFYCSDLFDFIFLIKIKND